MMAIVALPTAVLPNPVFSCSIGVSWWSYPVVIVTAVLGGLLLATYVNERPHIDGADAQVDRAPRLGMAGAVASFLAVGCPACNKLVLLAIGPSGAVTWFAPLQPFLALVSMALMLGALLVRLRNQARCRVRP